MVFKVSKKKSQYVHQFVSNRVILLHKSQLPIFSLIMQTLFDRVFAMATVFMEFTVIVKYCPFTLHLVHAAFLG